ncbi:TonB-dependent receptor [Aquirufa sp. 2-AUSEE-184A6]|uniref:TonB-dependent receptor n=1 Tax=Aquirufa novilacunae TaxID=3139305 RepID=A0ABW8SU97_9BACT
MKKIISLLALITLSVSAIAQIPGGMGGFGAAPKKETIIPGTAQAAPKGSAKIIGFLLDSTDSKPVEFATLALINTKTNKPVDGTVADGVGKFTLNKVAVGSYKIVVSFIGYDSKTVFVNITEKNDDRDLGVIKLQQSSKMLSEVTVEGQRALIEERVDRTVYNAEKDASNKGGDATDVLKKVPMLSVDLDGNPSLRGSTSVRVLINNKPSTIMASSIADALRQIPADMIKTVEVITSPSAKYDAEGSAGIINIVTKKNTLQGLTLSFDSSAGVRGSNLSLNGNFRNKNWGLSLGGFGRSEYNVNGKFESTQLTQNMGVETRNVQTAESRREGLFGNYQLGFDWDINKYNSITASTRFGLRNGNNWQDGLQQIRNGVLTSLRNTNSLDESANVDINVDYTHTFEKPQKEFSILSMYSRNNRSNDFYNLILNPKSTMSEILSSIKNENGSYNEEATFQLDYQTPIAKNQMLEFGSKGIVRNVTSDYTSYTAGSNGVYTQVNSAILPSNVFDYNQNILSSYGSYTVTTKNKWSIKTGARYEYTDISASFSKKEGQNTVIPAYGVLVPSFNMSKTFKSGTWRFSYNRRIQRPGIQNLNPNVNATNPLNISTGNPNLAPEYTNNYEVSYSKFIKQTYISTSFFMRNTTGAINVIREVFGDTVKTTSRNIGNEDAFGMNINLNVNLSNKLMIGGGGDLSYLVLANNVADPLLNARNEGLQTNFRVFGNYNIGNGWGAQVFSFYRVNQIQLQGSQGGFGIYSLSFKKDFKNKKGSIGFGAENFLTPNGFIIRNETKTATINQVSENTLRNMNFKINFSYRIGKMSFGPTKKKKSVNNDDTKGEGGDAAPAPVQPMGMPGMRMGGGGGGFGGPR